MDNTDYQPIIGAPLVRTSVLVKVCAVVDKYVFCRELYYSFMYRRSSIPDWFSCGIRWHLNSVSTPTWYFPTRACWTCLNTGSFRLFIDYLLTTLFTSCTPLV